MTFTADASPIVPDLDSNISSVVRKYMAPTDPAFAAEYRRATPNARQALRSIDTERVGRGARPLAQPASAAALRAASTNQTVVGDPDTGLAGDFARNAGQFISGLPRLPAALVNEVFDLPKAPGRISEGIQRADNPIEAVGNIAQAPGVRLVPGAFIASQFGTDGEGVQGLIDNPLWTALDVLPYASKGARRTATFRTAEKLAAPGERVGAFGTNLRYYRPGGPKLNAAGTAMEPNPIGRGIVRAGEKARDTRPGQLIQEAFGDKSRAMMVEKARFEAAINDPRMAASLGLDAEGRLIGITSKADDIVAKYNPTPDDIMAVRRAMDIGDQQSLAALTPEQRGFMDELSDLQEKGVKPEELATGRLADRDLVTPGGKAITETFTAKVAGRLDKARALNNRSEILVAGRDTATTGFATLDDAQSYFERVWTSDLPVVKAKNAYRATLSALDVMGYDTSAVRKTLNKAGNKAQLEGWAAKFDPYALPKTRTPIDMDVVRTTLTPIARTDPGMAKFTAYLRDGNWQRANAEAARLAKRKVHTGGVNWAELRQELRVRATAERTAMTIGNMTEVRGAKSFARALKRVEQQSVPARMKNLVASKIDERLQTEIADMISSGRLTAEQGAQATAYLAEGVLDSVKTISPDLANVSRKISREVGQSWMDLVDQGYQPRFVHRVRPSQFASETPRVVGFAPTPSSIQDRVLDFAPDQMNPAIALKRQVVEMLTERGSRAFVEELQKTMGRPVDEVINAYFQYAVDANRRNPNLDVMAHRKRLIDRDWSPSPLDPNIYLPRDVVANINRLIPKDVGVFARAMDKTMTVFRTALLPLSPRWHVYNMVGGAIMMAVEAGPMALRPKYLAAGVDAANAWQGLLGKKFGRQVEIWREARGAKMGFLPDGTPITDVRLPALGSSAEMRAVRQNAQWSRNTDLTTPHGKAIAMWDHAAGKFVRRILDESFAARGAKGAIDRSYWFNEAFDDMYRAASYLYGSDKALTKGMSRAAAQAEGIALSRKILANWDSLTPIERSSIRFIFPFYSWARHLLGFAYRYPADHPWRTAITASLVRAELEDFGTGLPQRYFSLLDVGGIIPDNIERRMGGDPDSGESFYLSLDGFNPFRDLASYATLTGFLANPLNPGEALKTADIGVITSQMNPMAQLFLQSVGVDPSTGIPDPYQQVSYDPLTGGLRVDNAFNPTTGIPQAFIPQSKLLFDLTGVNRDFQRLLRTNPDAAQRRLVSSAGIPVLARKMNADEEIVKAEVRRYEDLTRTRSRALRSGNLDQLDRYEALAPLKSRLEAMDASGELDRYRADADEVRRRIDAQIASGGRRSPLADANA